MRGGMVALGTPDYNLAKVSYAPPRTGAGLVPAVPEIDCVSTIVLIRLALAAQAS